MLKSIGLLLLQIILECLFIQLFRILSGFDILQIGPAKSNFIEQIIIVLLSYGFNRLLLTGLAQLVILNLRNTFKLNPSKYLKQNRVVSVIFVFFFSLFYNNLQTTIGIVTAALIASLSLMWIIPKLKST